MLKLYNKLNFCENFFQLTIDISVLFRRFFLFESFVPNVNLSGQCSYPNNLPFVKFLFSISWFAVLFEFDFYRFCAKNSSSGADIKNKSAKHLSNSSKYCKISMFGDIKFVPNNLIIFIQEE